ncbi:MAG: hypothetical protein HZB19_11925 [Chloroflexi bacterium]|nr:hypothetical protein [Chloroflexota bacterium]
MSNRKLDPILRDIKHYFQFLFDKGYKIHCVKELSMGDWQVILALDNCGIVIFSDQGEISALFSPVDSNMKYRVGLEGMIYFLSHEQIFIGKLEKNFFNARRKRFETLASLLEQYIDQITPYFGKDYEKYKHELMSIQRKYLDIYLDKYISKRKRRDWE